MDYLSFNKRSLEAYWLLLEHLNNETKLELADRLIKSLKKPQRPQKKKEDLLDKLYGAWESENETAEAMATRIRSARVFNRSIESLD